MVKTLFNKMTAGFLTLAFMANLIFSGTGWTQNVFSLPAPGTMLTTSARFSPAIMTGMTIHPENPLQFDFIVDTGDDRLQGENLKAESSKLINYFMATLTVPENEMWVNLSPYEKNRIIADGLSKTEMGRDMLAQDYLLKQLTASLMYPEGKVGKEFWERVYAKAQEKLDTQNIPTDLFNKVWIVPQEASVYVNGNNVFIVDSHLKVMLEEDYLALEENQGTTRHGLGNVNKDEIKTITGTSAQLIRELILPEIEKEVNEGKNFANLRQIYNSMILATWYKKKLKNSVVGQIYLDKNKTNGIELEDKTAKEKIYNQYLEAFKKGVSNVVKEEYDPQTQEVILRKYVTGGLTHVTGITERSGAIPGKLIAQVQRDYAMIGVDGDLMSQRGSDGAMLSRIVSEEELKLRFTLFKTTEKPILMGFMRDNEEKIQPIFSNVNKFQSVRETISIFAGRWEPNRVMSEIPLRIVGQADGLEIIQTKVSDDWENLPEELKAIIKGKKVLITSNRSENNGYSVLMAVTPSSKYESSKGRSGVLLKNGFPIVIEINGKEFLVEIKGVGNPDGGFDITDQLLRGGAQREESEREWNSLEMKRKAGKKFETGDTVRALADIDFRNKGLEQGYLIRLSPGSIRATYNDNVAFPFKKEKENVRKVVYSMGEQMGEFFSEEFVPASHPENLIVVNDGESFIFTDYSDILPIHIFPTKLESTTYDLKTVVSSALNAVTQIPGYSYDDFKIFLEGVADSLVKVEKITEVEKETMVSFIETKDVSEFLWKKFFMVDYYKSLTTYGMIPNFLEGREKPLDPKLAEKIGEVARAKHQKNLDEIERVRVQDVLEKAKREKIGELETENRMLERTSFTSEGVIALTSSVEAKKAFEKGFQTFNIGDIYGNGYFEIWQLWGELNFDFIILIQHLKKEAEFLEQVSASIEPDLKEGVERNLSIARERYNQLRNMTVYDYYLARLENPKFPSQKAILPYFSKDNAMLPENVERKRPRSVIGNHVDFAVLGNSPKETPGGIDFNSNNLNLKEQGQGDEFNFSFDKLQNIQPNAVNGILPVIINITPVTNFPALLGLSQDDESEQLSQL